MAERYSRVFLLEKNCYTRGCPVLISAGAILKDNQTGKLYGQLKLKNLQEKAIKAVKVKLICADMVGRALEEQAEKTYYDLSAARDAEFGSKDLIPLEDPDTRALFVIVEEVCLDALVVVKIDVLVNKCFSFGTCSNLGSVNTLRFENGKEIFC